MTLGDHEGRVERARRHLEELIGRSRGIEDPVRSLVGETLEELSTALEELHVAGEEMATQNESLSAAHAQLDAERRRYQELFDFAPDGYLLTDERGVMLEVNATAAAMLGTTPRGLVGKPLALLVPEANRRAFREFFSLLARDGRSVELETPLGRAERPTFPASLHVSKALDDEGRLVSLRWLVRDLTEARQTEALRAREAWFRRISAASPVGLYAMDTRGECVFSTEPVDELYHRRMAGLSLEEQLAAVHPDDRARLHGVLTEGLDGKEQPRFRARVLRADGDERWVEYAVAPLRGSSGWIEGLVVNVHDVSIEVRSRDRLAIVERTENLGRLAGGLAHDFNNLLHVVLGNCELAFQRLAPDDPLWTCLERVERAAERGAELTDKLLTVGRRRLREASSLDLNALVASDEIMLSRLAGEKVGFSVRLDPHLPPVVADAGELDQVLLNLVLNARDALPDGGQLVVETRTAEVRAGEFDGELDPGCYAVLEVRDSGEGMDETTKARAFEPFFTTKEGSGTGLGLSMVYGVVSACGGLIRVDSRAGEGTTFTMLLPASDRRPRNVARSAPASRPVGTETVLLVEDEDDIRSLARRELESHGYEVVEARGGGEALEMFRAQAGPLSVLVTDVVMQGMNGVVLARRLRLDHPELRVLFISGHPESPALALDLEEHGSALLRKPFRSVELVAAVRRVLNQGAQV